MLEFMDPVIIEKGCKMTLDERNLFQAACKLSVATTLKTWKTLKTLESYPRFSK